MTSPADTLVDIIPAAPTSACESVICAMSPLSSPSNSPLLCASSPPTLDTEYLEPFSAVPTVFADISSGTRQYKSPPTPAPISEVKLVWNVVILGLAFCLLFLSYSACSNLTTVFFPQTGGYALALVSATIALTCPFSVVVMKRVGIRATFFLAALLISAYVLLMLFSVRSGPGPTGDSMLFTSSVLAGLALSVLWAGQTSWLDRCSSTPARRKVMSSIFYGIFYWNGILGSLLSGILFSTGGDQQLVLMCMFGLALVSAVLMLFLRQVKSSRKFALADVMAEEQPGRAPTFSVKEVFQNLWMNCRRPQSWALVGVFIYYGAVGSSLQGKFPTLIPDPILISYVFAGNGLASVIGAAIFGRLSRAAGVRLAVGSSSVVLGCACATYFTGSPAWFAVTLVLFGLSSAGWDVMIFWLTVGLAQTETRYLYMFCRLFLNTAFVAMSAGTRLLSFPVYMVALPQLLVLAALSLWWVDKRWLPFAEPPAPAAIAAAAADPPGAAAVPPQQPSGVGKCDRAAQSPGQPPVGSGKQKLAEAAV
ncbi:hypothetical protein PAPYR_1113 [Paratrimastix pyriformis]|uniref:Uncharacterized protein n=1 Tax=Paratrimastix pyriformis TaxID=342808 RepID=A0ABQ8UY18_9EUKA|nr:hypothetical protein PAPYR_1113 [Paratrimastix pyriformis]